MRRNGLLLVLGAVALISCGERLPATSSQEDGDRLADCRYVKEGVRCYDPSTKKYRPQGWEAEEPTRYVPVIVLDPEVNEI